MADFHRCLGAAGVPWHEVDFATAKDYSKREATTSARPADDARAMNYSSAGDSGTYNWRGQPSAGLTSEKPKNHAGSAQGSVLQEPKVRGSSAQGGVLEEPGIRRSSAQAGVLEEPKDNGSSAQGHVYQEAGGAEEPGVSDASRPFRETPRPISARGKRLGLWCHPGDVERVRFCVCGTGPM